jgi:hypothetical protein
LAELLSSFGKYLILNIPFLWRAALNSWRIIFYPSVKSPFIPSFTLLLVRSMPASQSTKRAFVKQRQLRRVGSEGFLHSMLISS